MIETCDISEHHFHKVRGDQWKGIYQTITDKFVNKTTTWKNGLHWANTNGYSPKSMNNFRGCYPVDYLTWFYYLPQIIPETSLVYFLIDQGSFWYMGERFWIIESYIPELIKVLCLLNQSTFLGLGTSDYYIVSKKYKWL